MLAGNKAIRRFIEVLDVKHLSRGMFAEYSGLAANTICKAA
jgi:hypothetical protein